MNTQRLLLTWGLAWILVWMGFGLYLGPRVLPTREDRQARFIEAVRLISTGDVQKAQEEMKTGMEIGGCFENQVSAHTHAICLGFLALFLGLIQPFLGLSEKVQRLMALGFMAGSVLHPVGICTELVHVTAGTAMAVVGSALLLLTTGIALVGLLKVRSLKSA